MKFKVVIEPRAILDIQEAVDYYDSRQVGLGEYFYETLDSHIETLKINPFFQVKYKDYHSFPIKKFPFIILYYIDEKMETLFILSIFNTSLNPVKYPK